MLRKLMGTLTLPGNAIRCSVGDWWIPSHGIPTGYYIGKTEIRKFKYAHCYQQIKQNRFGVWVKQTNYIGRDYPLVLLNQAKSKKRVNI